MDDDGSAMRMRMMTLLLHCLQGYPPWLRPVVDNPLHSTLHSPLPSSPSSPSPVLWPPHDSSPSSPPHCPVLNHRRSTHARIIPRCWSPLPSSLPSCSLPPSSPQLLCCPLLVLLPRLTPLTALDVLFRPPGLPPLSFHPSAPTPSRPFEAAAEGRTSHLGMKQLHGAQDTVRAT